MWNDHSKIPTISVINPIRSLKTWTRGISTGLTLDITEKSFNWSRPNLQTDEGIIARTKNSQIN